MTKTAFMFPGQGSMEAGMGREVAEAIPEAMAVFDEASDAAGMDLKELCFHRPGRGSRRHRGAAACARHHVSLARRGASRSAASAPTWSSATRSASSRRSAPQLDVVRDAITLVRERGLAMAEAARAHPGSMAAILGLADEAVEALCHKIHNVWPANYNCPGQLVISGETPSVDEAIDEATREGARRAIKLRVSGAFHSPLVARAAERLRPAVERVHLAESTAAFMSTVTARIEEAQRYREGLVEQLTAPVRFTQAARELIADGVTTFVEVGPGNVLGGLLKRIDKSVRTFSVSDLKTLDEVTEALG